MACVWTPELLMGQLLEDLEETEEGDDITSITFKAHCLARDTAILLQQQLSSIRAGAPIKKNKGPLRKLTKMASKIVKYTQSSEGKASVASPKGTIYAVEEEESDDVPPPSKNHRQSSTPTPKARPPPIPKARSKSVASSNPTGGNKIGNMGKRLLTSAMPAKSKSSGNSQAKSGNKLRVLVRKRPAKETEEDKVECKGNQVYLHENMVKVDLTKYVKTHKFCYDDAFGEDETTGDLYHSQVQELVDNFFDGGTSTCFCFGQTASGKTFTLFGQGGGQVMSDEESHESSEKGGVYMLAAEDIFQRLEQDPSLCLSISMFEIYGQKVRDLFDDGKDLAALEDGDGVLQLVGLTGLECGNMEDFVNASNVGRLARSTTATGANATSSRSHAAMLFRLVKAGDNPNPDKPKKVLGKFSLIDLAGSERGKDNEATDKKTQMEGRQINQSLLALKEVIRAKELGRKHAPYRQSRLTQVLEESLTGARCHTTVIGCVSPAAPDSQQTLNTLRYAESLAGKKRTPRDSVRGSNSRESDVVSPLTKKTTQLPSTGAGRGTRAAGRGAGPRRTSAPPSHEPDLLSPKSHVKTQQHRMSMPPPSTHRASASPRSSSSRNGTHGNDGHHGKVNKISAVGLFGNVNDEVEEDDEMELMNEFDDDEDDDLLNLSELDELLEDNGLEEFHDILTNAMLGSSSLNALKGLGLDGAINAGVPKIKAMKLWRAVMLA